MVVGGVKATNGYYKDKIIITWDAYPSANKYVIFKRPLNGGMLVEVESTDKNIIEDTTIIPGIIYLYFVSAYLENDINTDLNFANAIGYAGNEIYGQTKNTSLSVFNMFTDETEQEILFPFEENVKVNEIITIEAFNTFSKEKIFVLDFENKNFLNNIVNWNTSNMPIKPQEPINILLIATNKNTNKNSSAILQYKKRFTTKDNETSTITKEFGTLIL